MYLSRTRHPEDTQFHHIVPRQVYTGTLSRLSEDQRERTIEVRNFLNELGYTKQETDNLGLYLPKYESSYDTDRSTHRGYSSNHKQYNSDFVDEIYELVDLVRDQQYTQEQTREIVHKTLAEMRQDIRTGDIDVGPSAQSMAASSSHDQGNVEPTDYSPPEGVELDRTHIVGLDVKKDYLVFPNLLQANRFYKYKILAYEIDCIIRKRETPWLSLTNIKNRYMVVESSCHDTYIGDAFLKLDYAMKMHAMHADLMLPYDLITEEMVEKQCWVFEKVESNKWRPQEAICALKHHGFVDIDKDNARWKKFFNDSIPYWRAKERFENLVFSCLTVRGKLIGLHQDRKGRLSPNVKTYIEGTDKYSNGEYTKETSDDTQYLKSLLQYLESQRHLKEAFVIVRAVTLLFPIIEHLIREGKKIPISDRRLACYSPPKTPRRVPVGIKYGFKVTKGKFMISLFGGVALTNQEIKIKKVNRATKGDIKASESLVLSVHDQSEEERELYASTISNLKQPTADVYNSVDPAFIQAVLHERSRPKSVNDVGYEHLKAKQTPSKEIEKTSCCVVM